MPETVRRLGGAKALAENLLSSAGIAHIDVCMQFLRELVKSENVELYSILTDLQ